MSSEFRGWSWVRIHASLRRLETPVVVLFLCALFWAPPIARSVGVEDFAAPFLGLLLLISRKRDWQAAALLAAALALTLVVTTLSIAFSQLPLEALAVAGKEWQYLAIFVVTLAALSADDPSRLKAVMSLMALATYATAGYAVIAVAFDLRGYYGISYPNEADSPSNSALMFFGLFVLSLSRYWGTTSTASRPVRALRGVVMVILLGGTVLTGSRTAMVVVPLFLVGLWVAASKERALRRVFAAIAILSIMVGVTALVPSWTGIFADWLDANTLVFGEAVAGAAIRVRSILDFDTTMSLSRYQRWASLWQEAMRGDIWFGCGRGCAHLAASSDGVFHFGLSGDNQYLVNLIELGLIGSTLMAFAYASPMLFVRGVWRRIMVCFFAAYAVWGMTAEVWQLSKGASIYWLVSAVLISRSRADARSLVSSPAPLRSAL